MLGRVGGTATASLVTRGCTLGGRAGRVGALPAPQAGRQKAEVLVLPPCGKHVLIYGQPTFRAKKW